MDSIIGRRIKHKIFGSGLIVSQTESNIFVKFESKKYSISFKFPDDNYRNFFEFDFVYEKPKEESCQSIKKSRIDKQPADQEINDKEKPKIIEEKPELLKNARIVLELIKTIILTDIQQKQFYAINDIKNYFLSHFNKNPGNLITRKLLIDVCIELYEEEKKYYFVDGEGNSLRLWMATSLQEWQYYGLGTVYNPVVKVKNKTFNIDDFTLYVYESINSVTCGKSSLHPIEDVTINTVTISGNPVSFNAYCCSGCNKYFITKATINDIFPQKNYPFVKIKLLYTEGAKLQSETILHIYGYTVNANGPTEIQRENLLAKLLTSGVVTKREVEGLLWHLINYNGRKKNMDNAKAKWESDLEFVRDFNLSKQKQINAKRLILK